jgi:hypothetical protein
MAFSERSLDDYVDVAQRIADFRELYPTGSLQPADPAKPWEQELVEGIDKQGNRFAATMIVYVAAAYRTPDDPRPGIGIAWEAFPGRTPYTLGSELMNAETSAWGRAIIAVLASDSKAGVASRQEVKARREERNEDGARATANQPPEVDEHGAATEAEQMRMNRGKVPGATRTRPVAPVDDAWTTGEPEKEPGSSLPSQRQAVVIKLTKAGIETPDAQYEAIGRIIGRTIESRTDLSYAEAVAVLADTGKAAS